jgi:hypothetical protein
MVTPVIVVLDEARDLGFEIAGQVIVLEQNAVLERLVPALDLALGLRIGGAGANDARVTIEIDFICDASHARLEITEDWSALLGEHYRTLGNLRTANGERQVSF